MADAVVATLTKESAGQAHGSSGAGAGGARGGGGRGSRRRGAAAAAQQDDPGRRLAQTALQSALFAKPISAKDGSRAMKGRGFRDAGGRAGDGDGSGDRDGPNRGTAYLQTADNVVVAEDSDHVVAYRPSPHRTVPTPAKPLTADRGKKLFEMFDSASSTPSATKRGAAAGTADRGRGRGRGGKPSTREDSGGDGDVGIRRGVVPPPAIRAQRLRAEDDPDFDRDAVVVLSASGPTASRGRGRAVVQSAERSVVSSMADTAADGPTRATPHTPVRGGAGAGGSATGSSVAASVGVSAQPSAVSPPEVCYTDHCCWAWFGGVCVAGSC